MKQKLILVIAVLSAIASFSQKQWTLRECVDRALEKNISIQQNKLNLESSKIDVDIAKGNFLPNLVTDVGNSMSFGLTTGRDNINSSAERYGLSLDLRAGGVIFNGFRNTNTYKQAQLGVESSKLDLQKIVNDISLFVVNGYLNVLFAKENLTVAKVQYEISKNQIEAAESRFKSGVIPKGDLLNVESTAATNLQSLIAQENALDLAILNLTQLLQIPAEGFDISPVDVGTPSANLFYKNSNSVYEKSLERMPEIVRAKLAIDNAGFNIELSKGAYLPTLSYSLGLGTRYITTLGEPDYALFFNNLGVQIEEDHRFSKQLLKDNLNYQVGVSLNIPIFNRFQTKNRVAQSVINKEIFETRLESEKLTLQQTIEQAF
ncbi:MAG: transporter, partial [Flavobacteriaceae bacterium CG_4_8_14_3_um_filter_31_8]